MSTLPDFRAYCEKACVACWGEPDRRTTKYLRWDGSSYDDYKVFYFQKRQWHDAGAKCGGGTLELAQYARGRPVDTPRGAEFFEAWRYAYDQHWLPDPPPEKGGGGKHPIAFTYPYHDENGELLYEVVRFDTTEREERFRYRRPDNKGGWIWKLGRTKRVLYRSPELIEGLACGKPVLICEGERDVGTAVRLGYLATTNPEGAGKWKDEFDQYFTGADVVIVSDNDAQVRDKTGAPVYNDDGSPKLPGRDHAADIERHLAGVAARVRKIIFPVKDLTEWVEGGHTREELDAIIEQAAVTAREAKGGTGAAAAAIPSQSRAEVHKVFIRWLGKEYETTTLDAVLAVTAAAKLGGDPAWLLVISGSGNAKTETVQSVSMTNNAHVISTIASEGALLSASPKKGRVKSATGGLLRKIGNKGVLVIKDFTSILSMDRNMRTSVLAALREIHDGRWERNVGTDGGQTLSWAGHIVAIGACTTAWDQAHAVTSSMGERFVLIRSDSSSGRIAAGTRAMKNTGMEEAMRKQMAEAVAGLINNMKVADMRDLILQDDEVDSILKAADIVTLARTGVETDYRGDVIDAHAPEMPTRFAKQLTQIMRGAMAIEMSRAEALALALRCARDSVPQLRLSVLRDLKKNPGSQVKEIQRRLQKPWRTINRVLEALHALDLLLCADEEEESASGKTTTVKYYTLKMEIAVALGALIP
jgi:hypothetical protein